MDERFFETNYDLNSKKLTISEIEHEFIVKKKTLLLKTLEQTNWNVKKAAETIKMKRPTFHREMEKLGIEKC